MRWWWWLWLEFVVGGCGGSCRGVVGLVTFFPRLVCRLRRRRRRRGSIGVASRKRLRYAFPDVVERVLTHVVNVARLPALLAHGLLERLLLAAARLSQRQLRQRSGQATLHAETRREHRDKLQFDISILFEHAKHIKHSKRTINTIKSSMRVNG